ncbi:CaiB/BaiF CoA transferase family protein [Limibacillus halophilus]|uniref:Crotonobetainyl-CoA:carnitine CoA-transferase CaiB-like acyl-CoA transferase n=1 Tax=Limibacillus halophilus TaxID=1579333 RepID=A0A839SQ68_9PROT|nr:CaiB/BaiF CoA-transferase family protein [Limibacillus halophilus]MBB3064602.1 crotonobetainyl-CoA:carnitine CoA-transferase CaiB-like acyl-CoA transferase [Limibacillus halophilus]
MTAPLDGLKILDLTRILAGPTATQLLGDLGGEVIKIERPGEGDDTRRWGPPFVETKDGVKTAAYFHSANRNKRSVTVDISTAEGQQLLRDLASHCDILVENFKVGGLAKYGLDYPSLRALNEGLIYCSITGFGQTGPYAPRAGYDYLAQGMGGIMSLTGEPDGDPMKVGIGIADIMCGMYAVSAVLAALFHRTRTGRGQYIDLALLDTQVAWLTYEGLNYLTSGREPVRQGSEHPNIVPYRVMPSSDGHFILAVGNDGQFRKFCEYAGCPELPDDPRYLTNSDRVLNRRSLYDRLFEITVTKPLDHWVQGLAALGVPCGPVNTLDRVFADPQVLERGMRLSMPYEAAAKGSIEMIGNPIKFSETEVTYRNAAPSVGADTDKVLTDILGLDETAIAALREKGAI